MSFLDDAVARLEKHTERDDEFTRSFGGLTRPGTARRYPVETWLSLIDWGKTYGDARFFEAAAFVRRFASEDRVVVGEILKWLAEGYVSRPASDKTLRSFRIEVARRLDELGFSS